MRRILVLTLLLATYYLLPTTVLAVDSVDLLWQGDTYTPPFYEGRSLWSNQSQVKITAIAHTANFNPSTLYYRWKRNGTVLGSLSGINKTSLTLIDSVLSLPIEVTMDVRDGEDGKVLATETIFLTPVRPRLIVIEDNPLYGLMLHKVVGDTLVLKDREVSFSAIPFFSRVSTRTAPAMDYTWRTNAGDTRKGNRSTYRSPEGERGEAEISLEATNAGVLESPVGRSFSVKFGDQNAF